MSMLMSIPSLVDHISSLGFIGAMEEGMTGAPSLIIVKATLDGITSLLFVVNIVHALALFSAPISYPNGCLLATTASYPLTTPDMLANFSACGGFIMMGAGMCQFGIVPVPVLCMLPSLLMVMPLTTLWNKLF